MEEWEKSYIVELVQLHNEIKNNHIQKLEKAIRIGKILTEIKEKLPGQFTKWRKKNLPFSYQTARNYMNIYKNKGELKSISALAFLYNNYYKKIIQKSKRLGYFK